MLRTCNIVRIAHLPVLRNDGLGFALAPAPMQPKTPCNPRKAQPRRAQPTSKPPSLIFDI
ncbi:MAG: hypothetical protein LBM98_06770 [Oscillospiraceae bacterium]|nr:hypothetical protein [Oscillospiraceae bacterium]